MPGFVRNREHAVLRRRHGGAAHAVLPQELVEDDVVGGIGAGEIEGFAFFPVLGVHFVEETVVAVAKVRGEGGLCARAAEQRGHHGGAGIVGIHRRRAEERFDGADHVDGGVEVMIHEGR